MKQVSKLFLVAIITIIDEQQKIYYPVFHFRHFETILYKLIYLVVSLKVVYIRDPGETQSVTLGIFNRQLTHRRLE